MLQNIFEDIFLYLKLLILFFLINKIRQNVAEWNPNAVMFNGLSGLFIW